MLQGELDQGQKEGLVQSTHMEGSNMATRKTHTSLEEWQLRSITARECRPSQETRRNSLDCNQCLLKETQLLLMNLSCVCTLEG